MSVRREDLYRFPWSRTDNPGGWVEVTDECDLSCPGCYRQRLEGHRELRRIKEDIAACQKLTNCDRMGIAGGEPLLHPDIVEVVGFIARRGMKPMLLTNGENLSLDLGQALKAAGLAKIHFHVDSGMPRPGWAGKTEGEMNALRQKYADLCWELGGIQCGFNITVFPRTLPEVPAVVEWARSNMSRVHHISFVAFRGIPLDGSYEFYAGERTVDARLLQHGAPDQEGIGLTSLDIFERVRQHFGEFVPCAYLAGTSIPESYKFLVCVQVGGRSGFYGFLGARAAEITQTAHHLWTGRYFDFLRRPEGGRRLFLLGAFDRELRRTIGGYLAGALRRPARLFHPVYVQSISFQQPNEILDGEVNMCDGCMNAMVFRGRLIPSCRLDEYRLFGEALHPVRIVPRPAVGTSGPVGEGGDRTWKY
jgi:hypothetical protein